MTAGHLYTIAGSTSGTAGLTGYNGPAASARLSAPVSVRLDGQGNVYIGDQGNARVLEIAATTGLFSLVPAPAASRVSEDSD